MTALVFREKKPVKTILMNAKGLYSLVLDLVQWGLFCDPTPYFLYFFLLIIMVLVYFRWFH